MIATESQLPIIGAQFEELRHSSPSVEYHDGEYARRFIPILNERTVACLYDPAAQDIDVGLLLQGFMKGCRARGTQVVTGCEIIAIARTDTAWRVETSQGAALAKTLLNAAGAWADTIAALAGLAPLRLTPRRRTALLIDAPADTDISAWPLVLDAEERLYSKPDAGTLLISPADETDSEPTDAQPDEYDIAVAIDRFESATTLSVRKINHKWAGLRTFSGDRTPVIGFDPRAAGFLWAAGLGGYGVQTSPAVGQLCAHFIYAGSLRIATPRLQRRFRRICAAAPAVSVETISGWVPPSRQKTLVYHYTFWCNVTHESTDRRFERHFSPHSARDYWAAGKRTCPIPGNCRTV
jgi:D-arginine dehydrogenase